MIEIHGLRKAFGKVRAVDGLDLTVEAGQITALLGPNGAGKTTTVSCLVGLQPPDAGRISIAGEDALTRPVQAKRQLSYVPEIANLYPALTPEEYLLLKGRLFGMADGDVQRTADRLLDGFGLIERKREPMVGFSKGMNQKVALASALLTNPKALVLDEPLSGLDVETTLVFKELVREFARRGGAVLYCSHMLDVVENLADRVAVLDRGVLRAVGTMEELRAQAGREDSGLEDLFRELTAAADPVARAKSILGA